MAGRPIGSGAREGIPTCPRHPRSHVVRGGSYGRAGARRQLFYCYPPDEARHRFTGALARQMLDGASECDTCESHLAPHQGPAIPEHFDFTVHQAARALVQVAGGVTYSDSTRAARRGVGRATGNRRAQLSANWVETLAPLVTAPLAETHWPETIVCDSTYYRRKDRVTGWPVLAFSVLAVWGYEAGQSTGRLWALHASHTAQTADWQRLFDQLDGMPTMVIEDQAGAAHKAAALKWPQIHTRSQWSSPPAEPFLWDCEHHLRETLSAQLRKQFIIPVPAFVALADRAFSSVADWNALRVAAVQGRYHAVDQWCARNDAQVRAQLVWRPQLPPHFTNGAVEAAIFQTRGFIDGRELSLRNKYRTNQLLELLRAHINDRAVEADFSRTLRLSLEAGASRARQLECADTGTRGQRVGGVLVRSTVLPSLWR